MINYNEYINKIFHFSHIYINNLIIDYHFLYFYNQLFQYSWKFDILLDVFIIHNLFWENFIFIILLMILQRIWSYIISFIMINEFFILRSYHSLLFNIIYQLLLMNSLFIIIFLSFYLKFFFIYITNSFTWIYFYNFILNDIWIIYSWLFSDVFKSLYLLLKCSRIDFLFLV